MKVTEDKFLDMFTSDTFSIDSETADEILRYIARFYESTGRHRYHIISRYVNKKMEQGQDIIEYLLYNIHDTILYLDIVIAHSPDSFKDIFEENESSVAEIKLKLEKLYDHIALEEERLIKNSQIMGFSKMEIQNNVMNEFNVSIDKFQKKTDEISNTLNANIITVVGLFSAIIFVFFGGITGMSSVIKGIFDLKTKDDIIIPLIVLTFIGFVIFNVIFLLLYSIAKIVNKNIGLTIALPRANFYSIHDDIGNETYAVCEDDRLLKAFDDIKKARRYQKRKRFLSVTFSWLCRCIKRVLLRYPYVALMNVVFVSIFLILYSQL
ncbi:hypothetical protein [Qiania dongpingensis]|uniref:Uncharacterized protein n=1 Tax=Qiania dongpingensis TaxID=2763669 RepID=A0A7G9G6X5_9FIRM|nr:hypothetical protein [Qiania dongpingensis]QNM06557.1 hypothetical protein H9Q78_05340 [Qiania dongpingensis]